VRRSACICRDCDGERRTVNCTKVSVLVGSLVSALSITSSPSFTVQVTGKVPTVTIDGTDGGQLYLGKDTLDVEIVTAKSSSINISLPVEGEEEGIFEEKPVPEQLKTVVRCALTGPALPLDTSPTARTGTASS
jgi:hypothetical protein